MKSWCAFSLFLAYLQEYEKPQRIHTLWTWPAHGISPLSPCKSSEPKLFSDVPKESFHQIAEITNNGFIDETCGQSPLQQQGRIWWNYFLVRFFRLFFFFSQHEIWLPSGIWMNELCSLLPLPRSFLSCSLDERMRKTWICFGSVTVGKRPLYHQKAHQDVRHGQICCA